MANLLLSATYAVSTILQGVTGGVTLAPPAPLAVQLTPALKGDAGPAGRGLPAGGLPGQLAAKASGSDFDIVWVDAPNPNWGHIGGDITQQLDLQAALASTSSGAVTSAKTYTDSKAGGLSWDSAAAKLTLAGNLALPAGASTAPALQFSGNANSGVWADANALRFSWLGVNTVAYNGDWILANSNAIAWNITNGGDLFLHRDAANALGLRNGTAAQTLSVYNTFPALTIWERGVFDWQTSANTLTIGAQASGTGTLRGVNLVGALFNFNTAGGTQFRVVDRASAANYVQTSGSAAGTAPPLMPEGSDANIGFILSSKGSGSVFLRTGSQALTQLQVTHTASAVNSLSVTGSATGAAVTVQATGSDTDVPLNLTTKGAGALTVWASAGAAAQFQVAATAGAVNYLQTTGSTATNGLALKAVGTDANISLTLASKGTFNIGFVTGGGQQFGVAHTASAVNWIQASGGAAGGGALLSAVGSDTNIELWLVSKGTSGVRVSAAGGVILANNANLWLGATGLVDFSGRGQLTFAGANIANLKGANGAAVLSRLQFGSTGTNAPCLSIVGTQLQVKLADLSADAPLTSGAFTSSDAILSTGATGVGYGTGAGGTVTQLTSKATGVTLNKPCGQIVTNLAALAANATVSFTLTSSAIAATDTVDVTRASGGTAASYNVWVDSVAAGSCVICVRNISAGSLSEALTLNFAVTKGVIA